MPAQEPITSADQAGAESLDDPLLKQAEQQVDAAVPPEHRQMYEATIVAGMNVMFSEETSDLMEQQLSESADLAANVSDGVAKLIMIVFNETQQDPNQFAPGAVLAATVLMCQALDFAEQTGRGEVTPELLAQCTKMTQMKVLKIFGITEDQVNQVAQAGMQQQGAGATPQPPAGM